MSEGLRERKKQRTRETIIRVALELFAERGYHATTLAEVAEAADISPRTIFGYFVSKEDILFAEDPAYYERLEEKLRQRPPGTTTFDAFRDFLLELLPPDPIARIRARVVNSDEALRARRRAHAGRSEQLLTESIAKDLATPADDIRARMIAASAIAVFLTVSEHLANEPDEVVAREQGLPRYDDALEFLRAGLEALKRGV
jgi:AcrR family transcriptional regulator